MLVNIKKKTGSLFVGTLIATVASAAISVEALANKTFCEDFVAAQDADELTLVKELTADSSEETIKSWDLAMIQAAVVMNSYFAAPLKPDETREEFFSDAGVGVVSYYKFLDSSSKSKAIVLVSYLVGDNPYGLAFKVFDAKALENINLEPTLEFIGTINDGELMCLDYIGQ